MIQNPGTLPVVLAESIPKQNGLRKEAARCIEILNDVGFDGNHSSSDDDSINWQERGYPDLPIYVEVHDTWSLKEDPKDRHPPRYLAKNGRMVTNFAQAAIVKTPEEAAALIVLAECFGRGSKYFKPTFHADPADDNELKEIHAWHKSQQG